MTREMTESKARKLGYIIEKSHVPHFEWHILKDGKDEGNCHTKKDCLTVINNLIKKDTEQFIQLQLPIPTRWEPTYYDK